MHRMTNPIYEKIGLVYHNVINAQRPYWFLIFGNEKGKDLNLRLCSLKRRFIKMIWEDVNLKCNVSVYTHNIHFNKRLSNTRIFKNSVHH